MIVFGIGNDSEEERVLEMAAFFRHKKETRIKIAAQTSVF